jgi:hypothetical protein
MYFFGRKRIDSVFLRGLKVFWMEISLKPEKTNTEAGFLWAIDSKPDSCQHNQEWSEPPNQVGASCAGMKIL